MYYPSEIYLFLMFFVSCQTNYTNKDESYGFLKKKNINQNILSEENLRIKYNTTERNNIDSIDNFDSIIKEVESTAKLWVTEWKKIDEGFDMTNFKKEWDKDLSVNWIDFDLNSKYFTSFEPMLEYRKDTAMAIDMYSYNTVLEEIKNNYYASFDVDNRVYVIDFIIRKRTEILFTGSYEILEECLWLGNKRLFLLGYIEGKEYKPFVWLFNIDKKKQSFYIYKSAMNRHIDGYFFKKFPHIKMRNE